MALNKNAIMRHKGACKTEEVHVAEWADEDGDDVVLVRGMTLREFEMNQASASDGKSVAKILARCILADESGLRLFEDADVDSIAELPLGGALTVNAAIMKLSGLTADASGEASEAQAVADAEGNSGETGEQKADAFSSSD